MYLLDDLNEEQIECVKHFEGPALVLAGAGSGKTRVITYRIAYLNNYYDVPLRNIVAVTFTNKAADEMAGRIRYLIDKDVSELVVGTIHSFCARILRLYADRINYKNNFSIYDTDEQKTVLKKIFNKLEIPSKKLSIGYAQNMISSYKNRLIGYNNVIESDEKSYYLKRVFMEYENDMFFYNAMDFDDLLVNMVRLLKENEDVRETLSNRFRFLLVDEYQDTNHAQYVIFKLLVERHKNIFVVGDDDQSIYSFRGADINNILNFEKDFKNAKVYKLERNYRSTGYILDAASFMIKNNISRKGKKLWTDKPKGEKIKIFSVETDIDEAEKIAMNILKELSHYNFGDIAIFYRTNAQSRPIEESLIKRNIPYRIYKGVAFYERKEIKDILSYMRFVINRNDITSFLRIINTPPRGIGKKTLDIILKTSEKEGITIWDAVKKLSEENEHLYNFIEIINRLEKVKEPVLFVKSILEETGIERILREEETPESLSRLENIEELIRSIEYFIQKRPDGTIVDFLNEVALLTDTDRFEKTNRVSLMTVHNAKGLEFPVVFISGLVEGLFPHFLSYDDFNVEEERRLFYVGLTRAKEKVYLSFYKKRLSDNRFMEYTHSRFIDELPEETIEKEGDFNFKRKKEMLNGKKVYHPVFGEGTIIRKESSDTYLISFNGVVRKIKSGFFSIK